MSWPKLRAITKAMCRKHKKDKENKQLDKCKNFAKLSVKLWDVQLLEYLIYLSLRNKLHEANWVVINTRLLTKLG